MPTNCSVSGMLSVANSKRQANPPHENKIKKNRRVIGRRREATMEHGQRERVSQGPDPGTSLPPHGPNSLGGAGIIYSHLEIVKAV